MPFHGTAHHQQMSISSPRPFASCPMKNKAPYTGYVTFLNSFSYPAFHRCSGQRGPDHTSKCLWGTCTGHLCTKKKKALDVGNLPELIQYDNADDDTANSYQWDDEHSADPILSQQSTDAIGQTQNLLINPVPRPDESLLDYIPGTKQTSTQTPSLLFSATLNFAGLLSMPITKLTMLCTRLFLRSFCGLRSVLPSSNPGTTSRELRYPASIRRTEAGLCRRQNFAEKKLLHYLTLVLPEHANNCLVLYIAGDAIQLAAESTKDARIYQLTECHILIPSV